MTESSQGSKTGRDFFTKLNTKQQKVYVPSYLYALGFFDTDDLTKRKQIIQRMESQTGHDFSSQNKQINDLLERVPSSSKSVVDENLKKLREAYQLEFWYSELVAFLANPQQNTLTIDPVKQKMNRWHKLLAKYLETDKKSITLENWSNWVEECDIDIRNDCDLLDTIINDLEIEILHEDILISQRVDDEKNAEKLPKDIQNELLTQIYEFRLNMKNQYPNLSNKEITYRCVDCEEYKAIRDRLIIANQRLVTFFLNRLHSKGSEDERQEAFIALMNAIDLFDPTKNNQFSTYVNHSIRNAIRRYRNDHNTATRIPENQTKILFELKNLRVKCENKLNRSITEKEWLKVWLHVDKKHTEKQFKMLLGYLNIHHISLDAPMTSMDTDDMFLSEIISDPDEESIENQIAQNDLFDNMDDIFSTLETREETFFRLAKGLIFTQKHAEHASFYMGFTVRIGEKVDVETIAKVMSLSTTSVRTIVENARQKLATHPISAMKIAELLNYRAF